MVKRIDPSSKGKVEEHKQELSCRKYRENKKVLE